MPEDSIEIIVDLKDAEFKRDLLNLKRSLAELEGGTGKVDTKTKQLTDKNRRFADEGDRKVIPFIRRYRWALSLLLITQNAIYRIAQGTKVLASMMNLLTKAFGFIIDMALIPFIPLIILAATWLFKFGEWLNELPDPLQKFITLTLIAAAALAYFGMSSIAAGLTNLIDLMIGLGVAEATATALAYALGLALGALVGMAIGIAIVFIMDETGIMDRIHNLGRLVGDFFGGLGYEAGALLARNIFEPLSRTIEEIYSKLPPGIREMYGTVAGPFMGLRGPSEGAPNPYFQQISTDKAALFGGSESVGREKYTTSGMLAGAFQSGSAPQSTLTNTANNNSINVDTLNVNLNQSYTDSKKLADDIRAQLYKDFSRNVTTVR